MSDELRAGLYAFDLVQKRAKRPAGAPDPALARPVTKVGVVGAGLMAGQLALLFARRLEVPVVLTDLDQARVDKGVGYVHAEIDKLLAQAAGSPPTRPTGSTALVTGSLTKDAFADADFVIEAVFEEMAVKKQVFAEVEAVVSAECVLATNTSSLSVTEMAPELAHPERVVGLPLLQPGRGDAAARGRPRRARPTTRRWPPRSPSAKALKKTCVLVTDAPAFVVNRLLTRFLGEVIAAVDEGTPLEVAEHALDPLGLPMRPFVAAAAGRPGGRAARRGDAARGVPRPVPRLGEPAPAGRGRARPAVYAGPTAAVDPDGRGAARRRRPRRRTAEQVRERALRGAGRGDPADARRGRRRRRRRTSTCA